MTGILNAASQDSFTDSDGDCWTYFQDSETTNIYYIVLQPGIKLSNGVPLFHLTEYQDKLGKFTSASCQITTSLSAPSAKVRAEIEKRLKAKGVSSPNYQAMPYVDMGTGPERNWAFLNYANAAGTVSRSHSTVPSLFGAQTATFFIPDLTATEVQFFKDFFGSVPNAGTVAVNYRLTATAHLDGVTAKIHFDSAKAYDYQRTFKWVS